MSMNYARIEENHVPMDPATIEDGKQYWTWEGQTYGTVHAIDGQVVSEEGQVYMCIDDPAWNGATRWVDASTLAPHFILAGAECSSTARM